MSKYLNNQSVFQFMLSKMLDLMENLFTDACFAIWYIYIKYNMHRQYNHKKILIPLILTTKIEVAKVYFSYNLKMPKSKQQCHQQS